MCTGNTIKPSPGNATSCETTCSGENTGPSEDHTGCGEFFSGDSCLLSLTNVTLDELTLLKAPIQGEY